MSDDLETGDDLCDLCMRSGIAIYRTTYGGLTVCEEQDCQNEADRLDTGGDDED